MIKIVEFSDYNCSYCKKMSPMLEKILEEENDVEIIFRALPKLGSNSHLASKIAIVIHMISPDKFADFHRVLMSYTGRITESTIFDMVEQVGVDKQEVSNALENSQIVDIINRQMVNNLDMFDSLNFRTIPAFVIGDIPVPSSIGYRDLKKVIKRARADL